MSSQHASTELLRMARTGAIKPEYDCVLGLMLAVFGWMQFPYGRYSWKEGQRSTNSALYKHINHKPLPEYGVVHDRWLVRRGPLLLTMEYRCRYYNGPNMPIYKVSVYTGNTGSLQYVYTWDPHEMDYVESLQFLEQRGTLRDGFLHDHVREDLRGHRDCR